MPQSVIQVTNGVRGPPAVRWKFARCGANRRTLRPAHVISLERRRRAERPGGGHTGAALVAVFGGIVHCGNGKLRPDRLPRDPVKTCTGGIDNFVTNRAQWLAPTPRRAFPRRAKGPQPMPHDTFRADDLTAAIGAAAAVGDYRRPARTDRPPSRPRHYFPA